MEPTKLGVAALVVVAASIGGGVVGSKITTTPTTELKLDVDATEWVKVVAEAVTACGPDVKEVTCNAEREQYNSTDITLGYYCCGVRLSDKAQAEALNQVGNDVPSITFTPAKDGERVTYKPSAQRGVLPNTDPVPVAEEPKPVEKPIEDLKTP